MLTQRSSTWRVSAEPRSRPAANSCWVVGMITMRVIGTTAPLLRSFLLHSRGRKSREFSRFAQHLVNFRGMQLLGVDHLPRELLQGDEASLYKAEQFPVELERAAFGLQRFAQHRRDVMLMRVEEGPDLQRWISPQRGNPLSDLLSMQQRFFRLLAQPRNDRNAAEAEDEEGIMRIAHDPGQFRFQQSIQHADN